MCADLNFFYLGTPMERHEFLQLPLAIIPEEVIQQYSLKDIAHNDKVYISNEKGMYGLLQAGILANKLLTKRLTLKGYHPCPNTPRLWKHE
jgi:hypothetical protein